MNIGSEESTFLSTALYFVEHHSNTLNTYVNINVFQLQGEKKRRRRSESTLLSQVPQFLKEH